MTVTLVYTQGTERRVPFANAEALVRRMRWLRDRQIQAVAYEGEREVGYVGPVSGRSGPWEWWYQPDLFSRKRA